MQKLFAILLLCCLWYHPAKTQELLKKKVSLSLKNQSIGFAINQLNENYQIQFSYSSDLLALHQKRSLVIKNKPLGKVLKRLFYNSNTEYKALGNQIVLRPKAKAPLQSLSDGSRHGNTKKIQLFQTVRGTVIDKDSKMPLIGASVAIIGSSPFIGTATDAEGNFVMNKVPVGRHSFEVSYIGYEPFQLSHIQVISGKELVLPIEITESTTALEEVVITANIDKMKPLNEMAMVSTRPFSVEETSRYAASFHDPARMARSFAGVSTRDDLENSIVIRGNAPTNLLWRLEGIEIPNPNHYGNIGSSGGSISMLSISTLSNSDFLTGAFPAEYGNSISGVFDLKLRNGNQDKRESSFMLGTLGTEISTEGPFKKGQAATYLFNYRYSSLKILDELGFNPVPSGSVPNYQDLSFKFNFPAKDGSKFTLFGIAGLNADEENDIEPLLEDNLNTYNERETIGLAIVGASYLKLISDKTYLKTISTGNLSTLRFKFRRFNTDDDNQVWFREIERYNIFDWRISTLINHKINSQNIVRGGLIFNNSFFDLSFFNQWINDTNPRRLEYLGDTGHAFTFQSYVQWKHKFDDRLALNGGLHYLFFQLNQQHSIEPRLAIQYQTKAGHHLNFGFGLHSYISHISTYFFKNPSAENPNFQLFKQATLPKAMHFILGYNHRFNQDLRIKAELYYQHLYKVPVSDDPNDFFISLLNIDDTYDAVNLLTGNLINAGLGRNYGLEITLEKFLSNNYYFLSTISIYRSLFSNLNKEFFSSRFDSNFIGNFLLGKEFKVGKNNIIGLNGRFTFAGGNRFSPIDLEASIERQAPVIDFENPNSEKVKNYTRIDFSIKYALNRPKVTHEFFLEVQNLLDHQNEQGQFFDRFNSRLQTIFQTGLIPNLNYRLSF